MRLRQLGVAAAALALAVTGLTACTSKVGAAALVDQHRITDGALSKYVMANAGPFQAQSQDASGATVTVTEYPRVEVLQELILQDLFNEALAANGGPITPAERAKDTPTASDLSTLQQQLHSEGFEASFGTVVVDLQQQIDTLGSRLQDDSSLAKTLAALQKLNPNVQVSARYGVWSPKSFSITNAVTAGSPPPGLPSFVTVSGGPIDESPSATSGS